MSNKNQIAPYCWDLAEQYLVQGQSKCNFVTELGDSQGEIHQNAP
ncbi:hypothetical protein [Reinekea marinisedimentorum]|uniref:Uncharacterized protein n=1 Tax=Reinekea marinisedimentorum TaxID=230495 RepID=A0A4R3I4M5_9GAMM|nr:hypothetical protein [Reinekea marinisedimentorum]TCS40727.1 hypothetical protein BCF53_10884 [Reinekea marinisedimentorum]